MLLSKDMTPVAIICEQRPYEPLPPKMCWLFPKVTKADLPQLFRFRDIEQLKKLSSYFCLPKLIKIKSNHIFNNKEMLMIALNHFASGENWESLMDQFGGDATVFGQAFEWFIDHLFFTFYHAICGDSWRLWVPMLPLFWRTIAEKFRMTPSPFEWTNYVLLIDDFLINMNVNTFTTYGFIDATNKQSCWVGSGPVGYGPGAPHCEDAHRGFLFGISLESRSQVLDCDVPKWIVWCCIWLHNGPQWSRGL